MTPLRVDYVADDYVSASKLHGLWSKRKLLISAGIGIAAGVAILVLPPVWPAAVAAGVLGGVVGMLVCYALSWFFYLPWKSRRLFGQHKALHEPYELEWDEEGLSLRGRLGQAKTPWDAYVKKKENERLVLLYHSDLLFQMLPKRAFTDEQLRSIRVHLDRAGLPA